MVGADEIPSQEPASITFQMQTSWPLEAGHLLPPTKGLRLPLGINPNTVPEHHRFHVTVSRETSLSCPAAPASNPWAPILSA